MKAKANYNWIAVTGASILLAPVLYILYAFNYNLFHLTIDFAVVMFSSLIFTVSFISRKYEPFSMTERIGYVMLGVAVLAFIHAIAYSGDIILKADDLNLSLQLLLCEGMILSAGTLMSVAIIDKKIKSWKLIISCCATAVVLVSMCLFGFFPDCYINGEPTDFRQIGEYSVMLVYVVSLALLYRKSSVLGEKLLRRFALPVLLFELSEAAFVMNAAQHDMLMAAGHYLQFVGTLYMYYYVVLTNIVTPFDTMFRELKHLSERDDLTGLFNRKYLDNVMRSMSGSESESMYMVMFDIDEFKSINDNYGHHAGDEILRQLALIVRLNIRENDFAVRLGGDEFAILIPAATEEGAKNVWNRIVGAITRCEFTEKRLRITVSAGFKKCENNYADFYKKADMLMYDAKRGGKNSTSYESTEEMQA